METLRDVHMVIAVHQEPKADIDGSEMRLYSLVHPLKWNQPQGKTS